MKFNNGEFKILIVSDFHSPSEIPEEMKTFVKKALSQTEPDLVVLLGDNTAGNFVGANSRTIEKVTDEIVSLFDGLPFAAVFGNHDHEGLVNKQNHMTEMQAKERIFSFWKKHKNCLATANTIGNRVGNYNLMLKDSKGEKDIFNLWFVDSGSYATEGGYAYVSKEQIEYYENECDKIKEANGGKVLPSLLFQHIIVPEIYNCFEEKKILSPGFVKGQCSYSVSYYKFKEEHLLAGSMKEGPCPPDINGGQFDSWKKKGDIIGAFFGHDHVNDFVCDYEGIKLVNVPAASTYTYGNNRGVRLVTLKEDDLQNFETEVICFDSVCEKIKNPLVRKFGREKYEYRILNAIKGATAVSALVLWRGLVAYSKRKNDK